MTKEIFDQYGPDPIILFQKWLEEAEQSEINDPSAVCLATVNKDRQPRARMVLVKKVDDKGFCFHTNEESRKGKDLESNPNASMCFYWKSLRRQICIEGVIEKVDPSEADSYFRTRPRGRQIGAWASRQSRPYEAQSVLHESIQDTEEKFKDLEEGAIPRPPYWQGYRLKPHRIEFWLGNKDRLHTRFEYRPADQGTWSAIWLYP